MPGDSGPLAPVWLETGGTSTKLKDQVVGLPANSSPSNLPLEDSVSTGAPRHLHWDPPEPPVAAGAALSREGVVSSHSVIATGLCSRQGRFGTLEHCRFAGLRPAAQEIVGALKCLQNGI